MTDAELEAIEARVSRKLPVGATVAVETVRYLDGDVSIVVSMQPDKAERDGFVADWLLSAVADRKALLTEVRFLKGLLADKALDSDIAARAVRDEREKCAAMMDKAAEHEGAIRDLAPEPDDQEWHAGRRQILQHAAWAIRNGLEDVEP